MVVLVGTWPDWVMGMTSIGGMGVCAVICAEIAWQLFLKKT